MLRRQRCAWPCSSVWWAMRVFMAWALAAYVSQPPAAAQRAGSGPPPTRLVVDAHAPIEAVGPVSPRLVGINFPVHPRAEVVARAGLTQKGTNGVWEALRPLNLGFVRQWLSAPECNLHGLDLPTPQPTQEGAWETWLREQLAPHSHLWDGFDGYMRRVAGLGDDVRIMLCLSTFPIWLGPFRWHEEPFGDLVDLRSERRAPYEAFLTWAGIDKNHIGDVARFTRFRARVATYVELLAAHCMADPILRKAVRYIELGNEPDNGGEIVQNDVRWRMFVYGPDSAPRRKSGEKALPGDEGLLQQVYLSAYAGLRAADPEHRIAMGGPGAAWAHNQRRTQGDFYYLNYFIDGAAGIQGVGRDRIEHLTYHNYQHTYDHGRAVTDLAKAFGKPVFLTEYNASAGAHGMNFMQTGATTVANALAQLAQTGNAAGAAFFKAAGGGFGMLLGREGKLWRTGAYWALRLFSEHMVGGRPLRWRVEAADEGAVNCLFVAPRGRQHSYAAMLVNLSDDTRAVTLQLDGLAGEPAQGRFIELPLAGSRNDYRDVPVENLKTRSVMPCAEPGIVLRPRAVVFLTWARRVDSLRTGGSLD